MAQNVQERVETILNPMPYEMAESSQGNVREKNAAS